MFRDYDYHLALQIHTDLVHITRLLNNLLKFLTLFFINKNTSLLYFFYLNGK